MSRTEFHTGKLYPVKIEKSLVDDLEFIIDYVEMNTRKTLQDCLDTLDEKRKVLNWLIEGYGRTGLPFSAVRYLTIDRICELYHVKPEYFENC